MSIGGKMKLLGVFILIICSISALQADPADQLTEFPVRIAVLGSSTAAGTGPSSLDSAWVWRYREYMRELHPDNFVLNYARGGYTTYHIMPTGNVPPAGRPFPDINRNITRVINANVDALIINLPSNDAAAGYAVADQLANYAEVVALATDNGIPVWIATTQPRNLDSNGRQNLMDMRDSTFAIYGNNAIDFWSVLANGNGTIQNFYDSGDGIHLNDAAHRLLFERVVAKNIPDIITGIGDQGALQPGGIQLRPNYPNPFNATTNIRYSLANNSPIVIAVYALSGQKISEFNQGFQNSGEHVFRLSAETLASGPYFYTVSGLKQQKHGKFMLIK
jgi:lysophospholipase L1-like esterase